MNVEELGDIEYSGIGLGFNKMKVAFGCVCLWGGDMKS